MRAGKFSARISPLNLQNQIHQNSRAKRKRHHKQNVEREIFHAERNLERAKVRDFRGRAGYHKSRRASRAHSVCKPVEQKRNRATAANIKRNADGRRHQNAESLVPSEKSRDDICGNVTLKNRAQKNSEQKPKSRGANVPQNIFQISQEKIFVRVLFARIAERAEIEKFSAANFHDKPRDNSAQKATCDSHRKDFRAKRDAVNNQLRIQQNRAHHKRRKKIVLHAFFGKSRANRNRAVHAQRRSDSERTRKEKPNDSRNFLPEKFRRHVNPFFRKNRNRGAEQNSKHPVPKNLAQLNVKIIPKINRLALYDVENHFNSISL